MGDEELKAAGGMIDAVAKSFKSKVGDDGQVFKVDFDSSVHESSFKIWTGPKILM